MPNTQFASCYLQNKREAMKIFFNVLLLILTSALIVKGQTANDVLKGTVNYLVNLKSVEYRAASYNSVMDRSDSVVSQIYFNKNDSLIGAKLHFKYTGGEQIYDGIKTITIFHEK